MQGEFKTMKSILITGSEGFIGTHLKKRLEKENIVCIDRKMNIELNQDKEKIRKLIIEKEVEIVIHLAATASVSETEERLNRDNVEGTNSLLRAMMGTNVKRIIFASSCAVYGENASRNNESNFLNPKSYYGETKVKGEDLIKKFCKTSFVDYEILRFGNIYGPGGKGVVNIFCEQFNKEEKPILNGEGLQIRDYVNVKDIVEAITRAMDLKGSNIINIGTEKETNVRDILVKISKIKDIKINADCNHDRHPSEIQISRLDTRKMKKVLEWQPKITLEEGMKELLGIK